MKIKQIELNDIADGSRLTIEDATKGAMMLHAVGEDGQRVVILVSKKDMIEAAEWIMTTQENK